MPSKIPVDGIIASAALITAVLTVLGWIGIMSFQQLFGIATTTLLASMLVVVNVFTDKFSKFEEFSSKLSLKYDDILFQDSNNCAHIEESELIDKAEESIDLLQETGELIAMNGEEYIKHKMSQKRQVKMRIVLCSPNVQCERYLALRNANLATARDIDRRYVKLSQLLETIKESSDLGQISVRYCPYPIAITETIIDSERIKSGRMIVRYADFRKEFTEKIRLSLSQKDDPESFYFYREQFECYSMHSYKKIVVQGNTGICKTYLKEKLPLCSLDSVFFVSLYKEDSNGTETYKYTTEGSPKIFARKNKSSSISIDQDNLSNLIAEMQNALSNGHLFIINGINILQAKGIDTLFDLIKDIMMNKEVSVIATCTDTIDNFKVRHLIKNSFANYIVINEKNRDEITEMLLQEIKASIKLLTVMK